MTIAGRIESYLHSDSITANKGGALVKVLCQTDFAARTEGFVAFARSAARAAYAMQSTEWSVIAEGFPDLEAEREALAKELRETITVVEAKLLRL